MELDGLTHKHEKGKFFGCYLLCSTNPKFKGRTYIGFTVNPNRRIQQHNSGYAKGGAKRTNGKGPWDMVLIIHGFPNMISALRFEWAWQNPEKSLRLKHLVPKAKQYNFQFKFNVVSEMLRIGPWCRLSLTVRWLKQEYQIDFPFNKQPPAHMPIVFGLIELVNSKKQLKQSNVDKEEEPPGKDLASANCFLCTESIDRLSLLEFKNSNVVKCISCNLVNHTICLADYFLKNNEPVHTQFSQAKQIRQLLPMGGNCPKCDSYLMWGELIKNRNASYALHSETPDNEDEEENFVERDDEDSE